MVLTPELLFVGILLVGSLGLLASSRYPPDIVLIAVVSLLLVCTILTPEEALAGFSNQGIATIAVLYVVVAGLRESGTVAWLSRWLLGRPSNLLTAQVRLLLPAASLSAFANNSPVVAMFTSAVQNWCQRTGFKPSQLLLPLSYASILGGTCTLIGTSTNLVVDGMLRQAGLGGFSLFELAWIGVPLTLIGITYLLVFSPFLLPIRDSASVSFDNIREYLVEMKVDKDSELVGQTV